MLVLKDKEKRKYDTHRVVINRYAMHLVKEEDAALSDRIRTCVQENGWESFLHCVKNVLIRIHTPAREDSRKIEWS